MNKKQKEKRDFRFIEIAVSIIEQVIEPLHYPKRGITGEKYYELEDRIIEILKAYKIK
jgi:hypothetical protein